jgi:AcrR family transcriptional regulator
LIEAAGDLFASLGFHAVSARQVAKAARVALSAIPYHFGTMDRLYRDVLRVACDRSMAGRPLADDPAWSARDALEHAVRWSLEDFAQPAAAWPIRLVEREMVDPSPAFREVVRRRFGPEWGRLCATVGRAAGVPPEAEAVQFGVIALYAITSTLLSHRRLLEDFAPGVLERAARAECLITPIANLTMEAVRQFEGTPSRSAKPARRRGGAR